MERHEEGMTSEISIGGFRVEVAFIGRPLSVNEVIEVTLSDPGHSIIDNYFTILPPDKIRELLSCYVDVHLKD